MLSGLLACESRWKGSVERIERACGPNLVLVRGTGFHLKMKPAFRILYVTPKPPLSAGLGN